MTSYTLRAETRVDADKLAATLKSAGCHFDNWSAAPAFGSWLPDVRITFCSDEPLDVLRALIATIVDGHVMYETIARTEDYTGERSRDMRRPGEA